MKKKNDMKYLNVKCGEIESQSIDQTAMNLYHKLYKI